MRHTSRLFSRIWQWSVYFVFCWQRKKKTLQSNGSTPDSNFFILSVTKDCRSLTMELTSPCKKSSVMSGGRGWGWGWGLWHMLLSQWEAERDGTEHVQSGCYINIFTRLAQCVNSASFFNMNSFRDEEPGDQMFRTYRVIGQKKNKDLKRKFDRFCCPPLTHLPHDTVMKVMLNTPRLSSAEQGEVTLAIYSLSVLIFVFIQHSGHWAENI